VFLNEGDGTFGAGATFAVDDGPRSIFSRDFDGDGDNDLVVANVRTDNVSVLSNLGDGTFAGAVHYAVNQDPASVYSCDVDGDGDFDLAAANHKSDDVSVLLNRGDGTFVKSCPNYRVAGEPLSLVMPDIDGDGDCDIVVGSVVNNASGCASVLLNDGSGRFSHLLIYGSGPAPQNVISCDLDGDGMPDITAASWFHGTILFNVIDG
jgi:hypothetical protein